jgi:hypothetical protein
MTRSIPIRIARRPSTLLATFTLLALVACGGANTPAAARASSDEGDGGGQGDASAEAARVSTHDAEAAVDATSAVADAARDAEALADTAIEASCTSSGQAYASGATWYVGGCPCMCIAGQAECAPCAAYESCFYDGGTYAQGETWTCADGCSTCSCSSGSVVSSRRSCADAASDSPSDASGQDAPGQ